LFGHVIEQQVIELMPKFYESGAIDFTNVEGQSSARVVHTVIRSSPKKGPDTVASRGQVPRSSPRLPPVMAEGDMRGAFFSAETTNILIRAHAI
jgi:hypothetical protein